jgi:hypothetical protein
MKHGGQAAGSERCRCSFQSEIRNRKSEIRELYHVRTLSSAGSERCPYKAEVAGSIPAASTRFRAPLPTSSGRRSLVECCSRNPDSFWSGFWAEGSSASGGDPSSVHEKIGFQSFSLLSTPPSSTMRSLSLRFAIVAVCCVTDSEVLNFIFALSSALTHPAEGLNCYSIPE